MIVHRRYRLPAIVEREPPKVSRTATRPVETVVFDLDGTLVHSLPDIHVAVNAALVEAGRRTLVESETRTMIGCGARALIADALDATGRAGTEPEVDACFARFIAAYEASPAAYSRPYDGVLACLEGFAARGLNLAVCTNKPEVLTHRILARLGLARFFAGVVAGDTLAARKPDAAPVFEAVARAGGRAESAVLVGDSATDEAAARAAGLPFIAVSFGYSRVPAASLGADVLIDRFDALPAAIDRLAGFARPLAAEDVRSFDA